jgi:hypothetical protein
MFTKSLQMGFVGLVLFVATACAGPSAAVKSGKHMVWVPSNTGSHIGGRWVEVDETGSAGTAALNVERASAEDLRRQQLQATQGGLPPGSSGGTGR